MQASSSFIREYLRMTQNPDDLRHAPHQQYGRCAPQQLHVQPYAPYYSRGVSGWMHCRGERLRHPSLAGQWLGSVQDFGCNIVSSYPRYARGVHFLRAYVI